MKSAYEEIKLRIKECEMNQVARVANLISTLSFGKNFWEKRAPSLKCCIRPCRLVTISVFTVSESSCHRQRTQTDAGLFESEGTGERDGGMSLTNGVAGWFWLELCE